MLARVWKGGSLSTIGRNAVTFSIFYDFVHLP